MRLARAAGGSRVRGDAQEDSDLDLAVIAKEPQLMPEAKLQLWKQFRQAVGSVLVRLDVVVLDSADAARLSPSRWHVMGDVAPEGAICRSPLDEPLLLFVIERPHLRELRLILMLRT